MGLEEKLSYRRFSDLHVAPEPSTILELCLWFPAGIRGSSSHTHPSPSFIEAPISLHMCTYCALFSANFPNARTSGSVFLWDPQLNEEPKLHHPALCALPTCLKEPPPDKNTKQTHTKGYFLNACTIILNYSSGAHTGAGGFYRFKILTLKGWKTSTLCKAKAESSIQPHHSAEA